MPKRSSPLRSVRIAPSAPSGSSRKVGYALIGLGHISQEAVLPAFAHAQKNSRLVALVSGDEEKRRQLSRKYGVRKVFSYQQYDDCLADDEVDAVYIALPNNLHAEYTERAARAGVHVLCEKPMAMSSEECQRMIDACEEADVRLMVAYRLHFEPANLQALELVKSGKIGEPKFFDSVFSYQVRGGNMRTRHELNGGPTWDIGVYCINAVRSLFRSEPREVFAYAAKSSDPRFAEVEETVSATMAFPEDRLATFICSYGSSAASSYRLVGTFGDVSLENAYEYRGPIEQRLIVKGKSQRKTFPQRDQFAPELLHFSDCVLSGQTPKPSGLEGLADVRVIEAIQESIRWQQPKAVDPIAATRHPEPNREVRVPRARAQGLVNAEAAHSD